MTYRDEDTAYYGISLQVESDDTGDRFFLVCDSGNGESEAFGNRRPTGDEVRAFALSMRKVYMGF